MFVLNIWYVLEETYQTFYSASYRSYNHEYSVRLKTNYDLIIDGVNNAPCN